ncbi:MAG: hypothetical protein ACRCX8_14375 [Sarcina sp.]
MMKSETMYVVEYQMASWEENNDVWEFYGYGEKKLMALRNEQEVSQFLSVLDTDKYKYKVFKGEMSRVE